MLKVGDRVRIREYLKLGVHSVVPSMLPYAGKEANITENVIFLVPSDTCYRLDIDNGQFLWSANLLEPLTVETATKTEVLEHTKEPQRSSSVAAAQQELVDHCLSLLDSKRSDYATVDYFHTFNVAAELQDITPLQALGGMAAKHVASVFKLINEHAEGRKISRDMWTEKIGDVINYLLIAWAWLEVEDVEKSK